MATTPQSLLAAGNCNVCFGANQLELQVMMVQLLRQYLLIANPNAVTDPKSLLEAGQCFMCYSANPFALQVIMTVLLKNLVDGGGGAGNGFVFGNYGGNQPNFTPAAGTGAAFDIDSGRPWYYYNSQWN